MLIGSSHELVIGRGSSVDLGEVAVDSEEVFRSSLKVFSASFLGTFDAESAAVFHNPNVVVANRDVLALYCVYEGSLFNQVHVIGLDDLLLVFLNNQSKVLYLPL